jgi:hypothetical protein
MHKLASRISCSSRAVLTCVAYVLPLQSDNMLLHAGESQLLQVITLSRQMLRPVATTITLAYRVSLHSGHLSADALYFVFDHCFLLGWQQQLPL